MLPDFSELFYNPWVFVSFSGFSGIFQEFVYKRFPHSKKKGTGFVWYPFFTVQNTREAVISPLVYWIFILCTTTFVFNVLRVVSEA